MPLYESIGNIVRQIYDMRIEGSSVLGMCLPGARNEMEAESTSGLAVTNAARVGHTAMLCGNSAPYAFRMNISIAFRATLLFATHRGAHSLRQRSSARSERVWYARHLGGSHADWEDRDPADSVP